MAEAHGDVLLRGVLREAFGREFTYRAAPVYAVRRTGTQLLATYGTGFKAPSLYQLYAPEAAWGPVGNAALEPEQSRSWDAGFDQAVAGDRASFGARLPDAVHEPLLYHAGGCAECEGSGFRGRLCVGELLVLDDAVREAVLARADASAIRRAAPGFRDMFQDGLDKALAGLTTLVEVVRVTGGM